MWHNYTVFKTMFWKNGIPSEALLRKYFLYQTVSTSMKTEDYLFNISTENFYISRLRLLSLWNFPSRKGQIPRDVYIHLSLNTWTTPHMKSWAWISGPIVSEKVAYCFLVLGNLCPLSTDLYTAIQLFYTCFCTGSP